jgi:hypothetical protein
VIFPENMCRCFFVNHILKNKSCVCLTVCSVDGRLNCGYSSFRGKRASMEDFYDIKSSKIDYKQISLFGIFDGQRFVLLDFLLSLSASI